MDHYLENPERLKGQPKRTIADYVEQNGILVPRRFDSLRDARRSHKGILLRSEHPQEYDGISGLLGSFDLSSSYYKVMGSKSMGKVKRRYFEKENSEGAQLYKQFCETFRHDVDEFKRQTTFSIWEKLKGFNRTVIADSSCEGRHHVMTFCNERKKFIANYAIVQDGKVEKEFNTPLPRNLKRGIRRLVKTYEQVRNLDRFDPQNCPIMEFQTHNGRDYFLQYHRCRDFSPATFKLNRDPEDGEVEVAFVRGATPEKGLNCKVTVYYGRGKTYEPQGEDGSFDFHWSWIFPESQFKNRKLQAISANKGLNWTFLEMSWGHTQRSKLFKPEISTIFPIEAVMKDHEVLWGGDKNIHFSNGRKYVPRDPILKKGQRIFNFGKRSRNGKNSFMKLHIVSDGRRAFVRRA